MAGFWESILPGGLGAYGYKETMGNLADQQQQVAGTVSDLSQQALSGTEFRPFGVTSNLGTATGSATGVDFQLSPEQQQMQQQLMGNAQGMFGNVMGDTAGREQEMFDRIRATQIPEEERQRMQMQQGMFNQGRMGAASAAGGGGAPEQFALESARAEAMNRAAMQSIGMAQGQQLQDYNIGSGMFGQSFLGGQQQQDQFGFGLNAADLGQRGQLEGQGMMAQLGLGGLTADTNFANIQGNAFGNMITAAMPVLGGAGAGIDQAAADAGGFWKMLGL